jgi:hypothetical protein
LIANTSRTALLRARAKTQAAACGLETARNGGDFRLETRFATKQSGWYGKKLSEAREQAYDLT